MAKKATKRNRFAPMFTDYDADRKLYNELRFASYERKLGCPVQAIYLEGVLTLSEDTGETD